MHQIELPFHFLIKEATPSQLTIKEEEEEEEVVDVSDSEDDFEVFNQPQSPEDSVGDLSHIPPALASYIQEDPTIPTAMVLQRKTRSSLRDLLESQVWGNALEKAIQTKPSTPPSTQAL